ncbi:MAG TPA: hypothetical protein VM534_00665 [Thermoanaerobaculia bacterium]|nr:hypothetical protein [Thermoanaerobaculia bacterium]
MRLERLTLEEEDRWRAIFGRKEWLLGSLSLSVTLPEFAQGRPRLESMHFGYYLQPLHLTAREREDLPRRLLWGLARRKPVIDFLELTGAGVRIPHCFPPGFALDRILRLILEELDRIEAEMPAIP